MSNPPTRVLIAGGGVAGLETLMALHALAGGHVELVVAAPEDEFVFRPLAINEPYAVGRTRRVSLTDVARAAGAQHLHETIDTVDAAAKTASTAEGRQIDYDALVLAIGAQAVPVIAHATTWDDRTGAEVLGGLLADFEGGYSRSLAVVIPPGPVWPLRGYELALFVTLDAKGMNADVRTTLVIPDPSPLATLGPRALELVSQELDRAGVSVLTSAGAELERDEHTRLVLQPSGQELEVDRVLALPLLRGRRIAGVPTDADGFIDVDDRCRVRGLQDVWAVGDATAFPLKSGGFAAEQADVAGQNVAALAGAPVEELRFDPAPREELAGLPTARFLTQLLAEGEDEELTLHLPGAGVPVLTYLQRDLEAGWRGET